MSEVAHEVDKSREEFIGEIQDRQILPFGRNLFLDIEQYQGAHRHDIRGKTSCIKLLIDPENPNRAKTFREYYQIDPQSVEGTYNQLYQLFRWGVFRV
jgi:hypothetical protein